MYLFYLFIILVFYSFVVALKIIWGITGKNLALFSDGVDSLKNIFTLSLSIFFWNLSRSGRDITHHWGHIKYDSFGSLIIGIFQIFISGVSGTYIIFKFNQIPQKSSLMTSFFSFVLMIFVVLSLFLISRKLKSEAIRAELLHETTDLIQTLFVFISTFVSINYISFINSAFALFIASVLLLNGILTIWRAEKFLVDWAPPRNVLQKIESILSESRVSTRDIKASLSSNNTLRLELILQVDGQTPISEAHKIAHSIEEKITLELEKIGVKVENCSIHIEPLGAHMGSETK
ncbi:MAG: cation diffusion facilitator family transporter [Candidatus Calescibacterium sp.]|jgi:cation diffusion facilitator family transporter|nr:cation diffusion facilitator family transporter [Candidatus Calescibacterium sp.]